MVDVSIPGSRVCGVDRPMGSAHPGYPEMIYPINYGYVPGVIAADGARQDAYILGADGPLRRFEGTVIAVVHWTNEVEDKRIVSLDGRDYPDEEILAQIHFQKRFLEGFLCRGAARNGEE